MVELSKQPYTTVPPFDVSFTFQEFASGQGITTFYLLNSEDDANVTSSLVSNINNYSWSSDTNTTVSVEKNFDTAPFALPRTIKGTAFISVGLRYNATSATIKVRLFKWDGSTETAITSQHIHTVDGNVSSVAGIRMPCTETLIAEGEQIRLEVVTTASGGNIAFGHDPQNKDGTQVTPSAQDTITSSRINIPFKIE